MLACGSLHVIGCGLGAALLTHSLLLLLVLASSSLQLAWVVSLSYKLARSMYAKVGVRLSFGSILADPFHVLRHALFSHAQFAHRCGDFL